MGRGDAILRADLGQAGPVAACDGGVAVLMEGPEAAGSVGWPIRHELGRPLNGWRGRVWWWRSCQWAPSGWEWNGSQPSRARLTFSSHGQCWVRCRVRRRAERVSRPAREKNRRRRVLVVTICSPQPIRAVQRARRFGDFGYLEGRSNQFEWEINQYQKISIKMIGAEPNRATTPPRTLSVIVFPVTANHKPIAKIGTVPTNTSKIIEDKFL